MGGGGGEHLLPPVPPFCLPCLFVNLAMLLYQAVQSNFLMPDATRMPFVDIKKITMPRMTLMNVPHSFPAFA